MTTSSAPSKKSASTSHAANPAAGPGKPVRHRPWLSTFWCKQIMAITGLIFAAFVFVHMIGNLKVYTGSGHFDAYAHWLRTVLEPLLPYEGLLWILRIVLLVCLVGHVACAVILTVRARRARGPHRRKALPMKSFAARTMPVTGVVLLLFVIFHILDLTTGTRPVASGQFTAATEQHSAAYANLVASFERPGAAIVYIVAMVLLALHLAHGIWTAVNDLGATGKRLRQVTVFVSGAVALIVMVANISIPVAVQLGIVR